MKTSRPSQAFLLPGILCLSLAALLTHAVFAGPYPGSLKDHGHSAPGDGGLLTNVDATNRVSVPGATMTAAGVNTSSLAINGLTPFILLAIATGTSNAITSTHTTTGGVWQDTSLSVTLTPKRATDLIEVNAFGYFASNNIPTISPKARIISSTTAGGAVDITANLCTFGTETGFTAAQGILCTMHAYTIASTTQTITFKVSIRQESTGSTWWNKQDGTLGPRKDYLAVHEYFQ